MGSLQCLRVFQGRKRHDFRKRHFIELLAPVPGLQAGRVTDFIRANHTACTNKYLLIQAVVTWYTLIVSFADQTLRWSYIIELTKKNRTFKPSTLTKRWQDHSNLSSGLVVFFFTSPIFLALAPCFNREWTELIVMAKHHTGITASTRTNLPGFDCFVAECRTWSERRRQTRLRSRAAQQQQYGGGACSRAQYGAPVDDICPRHSPSHWKIHPGAVWRKRWVSAQIKPSSRFIRMLSKCMFLIVSFSSSPLHPLAPIDPVHSPTTSSNSRHNLHPPHPLTTSPASCSTSQPLPLLTLLFLLPLYDLLENSALLSPALAS